MFSTPLLQRHITQKVAWAWLIGTVCWVLLLVQTSAAVRSSGGVGTREVSVGPLVLNTITRQAHGDSYVATISFEDGLIWYALLWLALGSIVGWFVAQRQKHKVDDASGR